MPAVPAVVAIVPMTKPTPYTQPFDNQPSHQPTGTLATTTASAVSPITQTGSLRTRSSQTPEGSENSTKGSTSIAVKKAHLRRAGVHQDGGRERQRQHRDLPAQQVDQDRSPQPAVGAVVQQVASGQRQAQLRAYEPGQRAGLREAGVGVPTIAPRREVRPAPPSEPGRRRHPGANQLR